MVFYAFDIAPITHRLRDKFPIVCDKDVKFIATLGGDGLVPNYKCTVGLSLIVKRYCPNITQKIID